MKSEFLRCGRMAVHLMSVLALIPMAACASYDEVPLLERTTAVHPIYLIEPGDSIRISVWGNPDLSVIVPVRPDGRVSLPLVPDLIVAGKTSEEVQKEAEEKFSKFVKGPIVSVLVLGIKANILQPVKVLGEAAKPQAVQFSDGMTLLDVMIQVGGLTQFAAGNRGYLIRKEQSGATKYRVRLSDLVNDGDLSANVAMQPGDILIIPQSWL